MPTVLKLGSIISSLQGVTVMNRPIFIWLMAEKSANIGLGERIKLFLPTIMGFLEMNYL